MNVRVHPHAVQRFQERVCPCSTEEATTQLLAHSKAIEAATRFGASIVKLGDGSRLVVDGGTVITVYGRRMLPRQCRRGGAE